MTESDSEIQVLSDADFEALANKAYEASLAYMACAMRNVSNLTPAEAAIHRAHYYEAEGRRRRLDYELKKAAIARVKSERP